MRRLAHSLVRLYPAEWRARYGEEFHALLDDCPDNKLSIGGILRGALAMRMSSLGRTPIGAMCLFALAGTVIMTIWSFSVAPLYLSRGLVKVSNAAGVTVAVRTATSRKALVALLDRHGLYHEERTSEPLEDVVEELRENLSIKQIPRRNGGTALEIHFTSPDPAKAQAVTQEVLTTLIDSGKGMEVLDLPGIPRNAIWPNHMAAAITGLLAGALLGVAGYFMLRRASRVSAS